jgi:Holliday junction DNA helicase RuvA
MIASLHGKLIIKDPLYAVVECGGVGMKCYITQNTQSQLPAIGAEVFLYTHMSVREDAIDLYGFATEAELSAFRLVTSVSGVGAKIGIALLSQLTPDKVMLCVASGDYKALTAAPGVGAKLAQKIIFELKDKVGGIAKAQGLDEVAAVGNAATMSAPREAIEALVSLGYSQSEASLAVGKLDPTLASDELIKQALKLLARGI